MLVKLLRAVARTVLVLVLAGVLFAISPAPTNAQQAEPSQVTTVLLVRHADRGSGDYLTSEGRERAEKLVHVVEKAGIKALFRTKTQRSQETVQPMAEELQPKPKLKTYPYSDIQDLKDQVLTEHAGQVVLVAAHTDTWRPIVKAFGANPDNCKLSGNEYDNLCVISVYASDQANVVNLQYGEPSP